MTTINSAASEEMPSSYPLEEYDTQKYLSGVPRTILEDAISSAQSGVIQTVDLGADGRFAVAGRAAPLMAHQPLANELRVYGIWVDPQDQRHQAEISNVKMHSRLGLALRRARGKPTDTSLLLFNQG